MSRFVCEFSVGYEIDSYTETFPVEHPDGPDGFRIELYSKAEEIWMAYRKVVLLNASRFTRREPPDPYPPDSFVYLGREWRAAELINNDGTWKSYNIETWDSFDAWFDAVGLYPGKV